MSSLGRILVVEDHESERKAITHILKSEGFTVYGAENADKAMGYVDENIDVVLSDLHMGDVSGLDLLHLWKKRRPETQFILLTGHAAINSAVEAIKAGAYDYLTKPINSDELILLIKRALEAVSKDKEIDNLRRRLDQKFGLDQIIGQSKQMKEVFAKIQRAAPVDCTVLILGENGTGKEIVAREIHRLSRRSEHPMISVDLGATAEPLFESELFGHVKGAFTGAEGDRVGRLKAADHSTLFLDEIGNLPLHLQPKLLTALEQREVIPVGANKRIPIDVRVVAATNASADQLADEKRFRQDLLFRLNTIEIELPPLRERREDVPVLLDHYLGLYARKYDKPSRALPPRLLEALVRHDWPGNVRALRHASERAVIMADGDSYRLDDFPLPQRSQAASLSVIGDSLNLDQLEKQMIERALRMHHFNVSLAASELGLSRGALYRRMEKHGL
jgi:DNA-binding NtrC family response regulator